MKRPRRDAEVLVIGAGAAGLLAATRAAELGRRVVLLEKNTKPGVKILISGGTRCNLTHATDARGILDAFEETNGRGARFLHAPLAALGPEQLVDLFAAAGAPTKVEATGKVFPASDRALDVQRALVKMLAEAGGALHLKEAVERIERDGDAYRLETNAGVWRAPRVVLAVGGQSYPGCGTTGDGYAWAKALGHRILPTRPALAPLTSGEAWVRELSGVTIPDARVSIHETLPQGAASKPIATSRGGLLFTHRGLSGPTAMNVSRAVTERPNAGGWQARCDFIPGTSDEEILSLFKRSTSEHVGNALSDLAPRRLVEALLADADISPATRLAEFGKRGRRAAIGQFKRCPIPISGTLGFKKAEVTAGGVDLRDVDSKTMQSKRAPGLYLAGEILDLDGPIGGYNFQAAFSTGWLAGQSAAAIP